MTRENQIMAAAENFYPWSDAFLYVYTDVYVPGIGYRSVVLLDDAMWACGQSFARGAKWADDNNQISIPT